MSKAKNIMILGTMSGSGKSLLCTALCRILQQDGCKVAPFKSQNMALNSCVTDDGLEMGRAQAVQAEAAGLRPDVRMNPILLKPCSDVGSQVIVNGEIRGQMDAVDYYEYKQYLADDVRKAYDSLAEEYDVIVIEGAGSPAEINLREQDIVNMGLAEMVDAPVLLVGDIDRGGVFAQLYGTVELLEPAERERIQGLVINKFRGDPAILDPGLAMLHDKMGIPILGVVPMIDVDIDDEDSLAPRLQEKESKKPIDVAIIRIPRISNFTDFASLESHPVLGARYVTSAAELGHPDMVILPGTKSTNSDLLWMRANGLEAKIIALAEAGVPVLGICGGYQMLGDVIDDPTGTEGGGVLPGMGLLPVETIFRPEKTRDNVTATVLPHVMDGALADLPLKGYEIHSGLTLVHGKPFCRMDNGRNDGCASGNVFGTYLHGLFDEGTVTETLCRWLCERKGIEYESAKPKTHDEYRQEQYDLLADALRETLDIERVYKIIGWNP